MNAQRPLILPLDANPARLSLVRLSDARRGLAGRVALVAAEEDAHGAIDAAELERRLLEMGFVEGARIRVLHEGFIGRDPIAVALDDMRIALRRREARGIWIDTTPEAKA
ncbi:FeoA family protein [Phenylobacterium montanum]|uniref:FeoA family protein n=1 Tax=Phenylobacterium montanum TaxID=2823693 RepID=UPI0035E4585F